MRSCSRRTARATEKDGCLHNGLAFNGHYFEAKPAESTDESVSAMYKLRFSSPHRIYLRKYMRVFPQINSKRQEIRSDTYT